MKMLVRVLAVLVRRKTGMGMAVKPALVFGRAIQLDRHVPDRAVTVVVIVTGGWQGSSCTFKPMHKRVSSAAL